MPYPQKPHTVAFTAPRWLCRSELVNVQCLMGGVYESITTRKGEQLGPSSLPSWRLATMCCSFGFGYTPFHLNSSGSPLNIQLEYQVPCRDLPVSFLTSSSVLAHSFISIEPYHLTFLFSFLLFFFFFFWPHDLWELLSPTRD